MKTIYKMYLDKLPMLSADTEFCAGTFGTIGGGAKVEEFLKNKYGKDLVQSVSLLTASDLDDNPDLMYAFTVKVDAGNNIWNGRVMAEQLDEW